MGLNEHLRGIDNVWMVINYLLLLGNIEIPGAGPTPVSGHSNVRGQRTVGITQKTELVPVGKLGMQHGSNPSSEKGLDTVETARRAVHHRLRRGAGEGIVRRRKGLIVKRYAILRGCLGAYYPEANILIPVEHHAEQSHVPAAKSIPVKIRI